MKLLYCTYSHYLLGVINRYLSDLDSSKDLLQDSFLLIFDRIEKFKYRGEGSLKAWLTRVVINESLMFLRHSKKMDCCSFDDAIAVDLELEEEEPEESFLDSLSYGDLMALIDQLPPGYKTIFMMYVVDGYSHKEIAKKLGINEKSSSSQLARAKKFLCKEINKLKKV
ncbi:RNA polymerase sigma factor [Falsiporphyromonas endometrii]|uniref:RNA polymerase sigma factor n=1 Tax=Falsiporphyromonas endometrii TaxID=1387297 RepID=A0ABV9K7G3_9PORP|nr:sigma-70 family RNA polymerase sigma factor [Porphyromonadaceae bacterium]